jgi:ADP-ribose pyrophosphatase
MTTSLDWKEVGRTTVHEAHGRSLAEVTYELPSGVREVFTIKVERPCAAVVAATRDGKMILTRQFRPGPRKVLYELPGGYIDDGEDVIQAAARELREETGYSGSFQVAGKCYNDAYSEMVKWCVVATGATKEFDPRPDPAEFIEVLAVEISQFRSVLKSGEMTDADAGYMAMDFLGLL